LQALIIEGLVDRLHTAAATLRSVGPHLISHQVRRLVLHATAPAPLRDVDFPSVPAVSRRAACYEQVRERKVGRFYDFANRFDILTRLTRLARYESEINTRGRENT
jgi:hypothetical protein